MMLEARSGIAKRFSLRYKPGENERPGLVQNVRHGHEERGVQGGLEWREERACNVRGDHCRRAGQMPL